MAGLTPPEDLSVFEEIARSKASIEEIRREVRLAAAARRISGLVLGALLGAAAASVAPLVNGWILLPGVPLDYGLGGVWGSIAVAAVAGALLGGITAWPESSLWGIAAGDLLVLIAGIAGLERSRTSTLALQVELSSEFYVLLIVLGVVFIATPLLIVLRIFCNAQGEHRIYALLSWTRLRWLIPALLIVVCLGIMPLNPPRRHQALLRMDIMIRQGRSAAATDDLPGPLRDPARVGDFTTYGKRAYTLRPSADPTLRSALDDNLSPFDQLVLARFSDGSLLACLFKDGINLVYCKRLTVR